MPLAPGTRIGVYEISAQIGEGGMGQVFRARDTRLDRDVAIKILPDALAHDVDRRTRFEREAKMLAALNHPNIAQIYGVEGLAGQEAAFALVMELVEGPTLAELLASGSGLQAAEAIPIARQIAEALEAAHDQGIVHRDLKPANIKVRRDGTVKVLDFGLAKAFDAGLDARPEGRAYGSPVPSSLTHSPTVAVHATQLGVILGTAAYMSPEQAAGKPVDKRSDIWSYGVVLWEMLAGEPLFTGTDGVSHLIADVLRAPIDFTKVPAGPLRRLLERCLDRDVKTRLRDIGEARVALDERSLAKSVIEPAAVSIPARAKTPWTWIAVTTALAILAAAAFWGRREPAASAPRALTHFTTVAPQGIGINPIDVSPDGSRLVFVNTAMDQVYMRAMDDPTPKRVPGLEHGRFATFSPDGQSLAFLAGTSPPFLLQRVAVAGGTPVTLADGIMDSVPMSWAADDTILLGGTELRRVPAGGGKPITIAKVDAASGIILFASPQLLPGGKMVLASAFTQRGVGALHAVAIDVASGSVKVLLDGVGEARFAPTGNAPDVGHLVYALNGTLFAATFNASTLQVGTAVPVLEGQRNLGGLTSIGFSRSGTLAYPGSGGDSLGTMSTLMWVDRQGAEQALDIEPGLIRSPKISPDGKRIAFSGARGAQRTDLQVSVYNPARGTTTPLTNDRINTDLVWSADGTRLIYLSITSAASGTLASVAADGSGQPVTLIGDGLFPSPTSVSPDGHVIGVRSQTLTRSGTSLWVLPPERGGTPQPFLDTHALRGDPQFSPNGKWIAYESNEGGRTEIYVVPYPGPGARTPVSAGGGTQPRWNRNGRELFFRSGAKMMVASVETGATFEAGPARPLFEKVSVDYDVAPDGTRFLMLKQAAGADATTVHVILNWFDDLRRRVPLNK